MFSPVYEDVSGLFGHPMPISGFGPSAELQFPQTNYITTTNAPQTPTQQQQQQLAGRATVYSLVDASGVQLHRQAAPPQQIPMSGVPFGAFDGASIVPYEVFMQHHQQQQQLAAAGKPTAVHGQDGVKYYLSSSTGAPVMASAGPAAATQANIMQMQQHGATLYALESNGTTTALTSTPPAGGLFSGAAAANVAPPSGEYPFYAAATGFLSSGPLGMAPATVGGSSATPYAIQGHMPSASPRARGAVNSSPAAIAGNQHHSNSGNNSSASTRRENQATLQEMLTTKTTLEVFDPDFKLIYNVPTNCVVHLPPARLNITRLVLCRNYRPHEPQSCAMGSSCKFVHADCNYTKLEAHPIHVNYIWRHETLCTYPRMPAGERLEVVQPDGHSIAIPSERILLTAGAAAHAEAGKTTLTCCDSYENSGMCNCGERCNFIHAVHVDPNVQGDFKRAPRKRDGQSNSNNNNNTSSTSNHTIQCNHHNGSSGASNGGASGRAQRSGSSLTLEQLPQRRQTNSPDTVNSSSSNATNATVLNGAKPNKATPTPVEGILNTSASAKLQEAVAQQLHAAGSMNMHSVTPSFSISLTPFAIQTMASSQSLGTLLYLPRGASEATVLGPVGAGEMSQSSP
ncbi:hypothetical protein conserved [Leishmania donovani]|uniref:Hypothetical_protein_conserved n=1 Tax=Leishmania donovani TaxID=5661 RepID=A0A6J8F8F4_LEIDO|nr:hypothetical protein conserved [Leishmania donovani]VDZ43966.1 hypothetical_protein_conserved [Leishmania donovani]